MISTRNTPPPAKHDDIVESELLDMLQTVIEARCGLSAIHQLLDEAKTMADIRSRFSQWQIEQRSVQTGMATTPGKPAAKASKFVRR